MMTIAIEMPDTTPKVHKIALDDIEFQAVWDARQTALMRFDDVKSPYLTGDYLVMYELNRKGTAGTGRAIMATVTNISIQPQYMRERTVMLSYRILNYSSKKE